MNIWDILIIAVLVGVLILAVGICIASRRKGKSVLSCGGDCAHCANTCGHKSDSQK